MKKIISIIMALAMLVTPANITSVKADQIYNIEKSSQSQITENKIEKLISSQKADIRTGTVTIENKRLEACFCKVKKFSGRPDLLWYRRQGVKCNRQPYWGRLYVLGY